MRIASTTDLSDGAEISAFKEKIKTIKVKRFKQIIVKDWKSTVSR